MNRRKFTQLLFASTAVLGLAKASMFEALAATAEITKLTLTNAEWKKRLSPEQYNVLREEGTERPFSSPLNNEKHVGVFACAGCGLELFPSKFKFDSGTGWPSFFDVFPARIEKKSDYTLGIGRTEYHCAKCGGHHGHLFEDGPAPTGLRYCSNGVALKFIPA